MKTSSATASSKLKTRLNMAVSLDGHTIMPDGSWPTAYKEDWRRMNRLREWSDSVLVSRSTLAADNPNLFIRDKPTKRKQPRPVILLREKSRELQQEWRVFSSPHPKPLLAVYGEGQGDEQTVFFQSAQDLLNQLQARGMRKILLETGPRLSGFFLQANQVQEVFLTMMPFAIGGDSPDRVFWTTDYLDKISFRIKSVHRHRSLLFLRYERNIC